MGPLSWIAPSVRTVECSILVAMNKTLQGLQLNVLKQQEVQQTLMNDERLREFKGIGGIRTVCMDNPMVRWWEPQWDTRTVLRSYGNQPLAEAMNWSTKVDQTQILWQAALYIVSEGPGSAVA